MNCAECRDNLVACLEGLLDPEQYRQCHAHLGACETCRSEYIAFSQLQARLVAAGQAATAVALVEPVMKQVHMRSASTERIPFMKMLLSHWKFGTLATASAAILLVVLLASRGQASAAAQVLARGARALANITSIHLRGQVRTAPAENFANIDVKQEFSSIELWKVFDGGYGKWRIEKPGRIAAMDGQSTLLWIKPNNFAVKAGPARSAFDTDWLHRIANLSQTIADELKNAQEHGWPMKLVEQQGADGKPKAIVTIETSSGLPENDYLKNQFMNVSDTRRVYRFDAESERLEAVEIYLRNAGAETLVFELSEIAHNPSIDPAQFRLELPANVTWHREMQALPDNEKYASMTAEQRRAPSSKGAPGVTGRRWRNSAP
jgi:outer membrane lipoprotein-sorting protein